MARKEEIELTGPQLDLYIDLVLSATKSEDFDREALPFLRKLFPEAMNKAPKGQFKSADDIVRRRMVRRYGDYKPAFEGSRASRVGEPWSWYEDELMDRAHLHQRHKPDSERRDPITVEHSAVVLQRSIEEVVAYIELKRTTRNGVKGFSL